MKKLALIAVFGAATILAGCGTTPQERTTGGAGTGAATGAAIGALGGPVGAGVGALIGAGAGAVTGAVTSPREVNLGRPIWDRPGAHVGPVDMDVCHQDC